MSEKDFILEPETSLAGRGCRDAMERCARVGGWYLQLTKPGIVMGNWVATMGGFFLAARGAFDAQLFLMAMLGVALVVASGCVFNNTIDRDIDSLMRRTRRRVMVRGVVPRLSALIFALGLAGAGLFMLASVSALCAGLGAAGLAIYVGLYTLVLKRCSPFATVVGSLSGALPPVIGYCAVSGQVDGGALLLLAIFSLWQIPHSHAIAIMNAADYRAARVPVLPVVRGLAVAKRHILVSILAFAVASLSLTVFGYTGFVYLAAAAALGAGWFMFALATYRDLNDQKWARRMFLLSIVGNMVLNLLMALDYARVGGVS